MSLDVTFSALSNPARRAILQRLQRGDATVTELADPLDMSMPAVSRHLKVLEQAGLIDRRKDAQRRICSLNAEPLRDATAWMANYAQFWEQSFDRLDDYLLELQSKNQEPK